ncbi:hypothetical protein EI42_01460 [Thermosporothrix hazakensis]|jgi:uncharacterized protein (TIGR00730 family)|uniref:Cytokinin riboside 5'-monophosphate phosphoribohydrolase n=2 Tax=Thermosporothrix TaxID=768650 RepID=A0A326UC17_THEHA|nr:TIGR00730 family Rossman fold protein [Thermosporothrix hazakensis]PZW32915.1 hypothetical protein EI42_01460 [Thermosporothrix hazakensis]BBH90896.1 cytokinin riboside 5'-monophosphate phosphoribohydrolase [Thermosporothrix sp. COM3]GCE48947.1 cytokinin riboside 5'-monophosphate phosphoribohydrolase [Thermosporothrix hazakensis]
MLRRICVYCGSSSGFRKEYREAAEALGRELAERKLGLVYGGASVGLMGTVADSVLAAGGEAIGVLPRALFGIELMHKGLTQLHEVGSMHERKQLMADLSDGFIALPGGFGTFDELFEIITWAQLGIHQKPVGLLNVAGYFQPLLAMVDHAIQEGFVKEEYRSFLLVHEHPAALLESIANFTPRTDILKWIDEEKIEP